MKENKSENLLQNEEVVAGDVTMIGVTGEYESISMEEPVQVEPLTLPFMCSVATEIEYFDDDHSEPLKVHLMFTYDATQQSGTLEQIEKLQDFLDNAWSRLPRLHTLPSGEEVELSGAIPSVYSMPGSLAARLTAKQRRWLVNGSYLQLGFSVESRPCEYDLNPAIATAMTLYDAEVVGSGFLHPTKHLPKRRLSLADLELVYEVNRVYDEEFGSADWNHNQVPLRNELLIRLGAELRGLDPDAEYKRYVDEGHAYFLDFVYSN